MEISLVNKKESIYIFQLDEKNYIKFCPKRGGIITNWVSDANEILYFDEKRFTDKTKSIRGGIPILFPICGNLDIPTSFFGKNYMQLMQHGFARDLQWEYCFNDKKEALCLKLKDNEITKLYYPYNFDLIIEVSLKINCLKFEVTIKNNSIKEMPINFGLHPYFNISDFKNLDFLDFSLNCQNQQNNCLRNTFDELQNIQNGIDLLMHSSGRSSFRDNFFKRKITLINPSPFDLCVIWSDPPRKMVCLEPWTSPRNSLIDGFRKILIPPDFSQALHASIQINSFT
ncbi:Galactose mutarotase and related enzymes [Prochlorococcus marinus str. MIT 9515]|uniref:Galactose mutarotase and related enzymes n=1 Tax=Prochlorococcus marinus (strain MIT 9515) TaxID=167542 RepID=A2BYY1_PROM5|nr:galactose mutarotase [Prochlorococcus marinus]ABM72992.1 Galactose mutarotase and related enzymes [Prochlorococcus marinus str. MIT 9515]